MCFRNIIPFNALLPLGITPCTQGEPTSKLDCFVTGPDAHISGGGTISRSPVLTDRLKASPVGMEHFDFVDNFFSTRAFAAHDGKGIYGSLYQDSTPIAPERRTSEAYAINSNAIAFHQAFMALCDPAERFKTVRSQRPRGPNDNNKIIIRGISRRGDITRRYIHAPFETRLELVFQLAKRCARLGIEAELKIHPINETSIATSVICYVPNYHLLAFDSVLKEFSREFPNYFYEGRHRWNQETGITGVTANLGSNSPGVLLTIAFQHMLYEASKPWNELQPAEKLTLYAKWLMCAGVNPLNPTEHFLQTNRNGGLQVYLGDGVFSLTVMRDQVKLEEIHRKFIDLCRHRNFDLNCLDVTDPRCFLFDEHGVFIETRTFLPRERLVFHSDQETRLPLEEHQVKAMILQHTTHDKPKSLGIHESCLICVHKKTGQIRSFSIQTLGRQKKFFTDTTTKEDFAWEDINYGNHNLFVFRHGDDHHSRAKQIDDIFAPFAENIHKIDLGSREFANFLIRDR